MGAQGSKVNFRQAVIDLTSKHGKQNDENFWEQLWSPDSVQSVNDVFAMIPADDIRKLREDSPKNLATLCYKTLEKLQHARDHPNELSERKVLNCVRLLTRLMPYMFEDAEWRGYYWASVPSGDGQVPMASVLLGILGDLLFCPGFTVAGAKEKVNDLSSLETCELIWEAGVGFANKPVSSAQLDQNRTEVLKLLLTCFSEVIYAPVTDDSRLRWVARFTSAENRHVLPLFTSLLNVVCAYNPVGMGLPYNYLLFNDYREPLVEVALQVLIVCLDKDSQPQADETGFSDNYFINYLGRIHREEDFEFMLKGLTRLLSNPLQSTYLPNSVKKVNFHQELLVLLWKCCEYNQKFMFYVLKTSDVLEILVPILYHITESRNDPTRVGLIHMGVFLVLLLSGERNFGVRLNKPYIAKAAIDVQAFSGTHADLLIIVFHKLITTGNHRLQSLFDCLLTIIVNVSPYLKSLSMVAANKLLHLVEAFSTPWFLFSSPTNHHLVFFLLEIFNNIVQYQFDGKVVETKSLGNSNLIYTIIRKRQVFYQLANLPTDAASISKTLSGRKGKARDEMVDQLKSPTAPVAPEIPTGSTTGLAATPQVTSLPGSDGESDSKATPSEDWAPTAEWAEQWKSKLPLQTIMRLLQVLVPQVEKICIDKGLTDESEILKFLQHGTLVGLLPVPHPILIRKYQANAGTNHWFRTYMWGVIYLRNTDPPIWYDTEVKLFEIQ
ncbi:High temperature-Induced Dauer formation [Trichostrongylus colubriformis]|uniref:High temperature-Induced Dauer formation n=1 Tax=Trichostrongylus colubriformis TaxID=6319 RepID=A0AAN8G8M9_TRICO